MIIYTNAPLVASDNRYWKYLVDENGEAVEIPAGSYKCMVKDRSDDSTAILTFTTAGGAGLGTVVRTTATIDDVSRDVLQFAAAQSLLANLTPGKYVADVIRTDVATWIMGFEVEVRKGITDP